MKKLEEDVRQYKEELRTYQERERLESPAEPRTEQREGFSETQYPTATGPMTDVRVERKGEEKVPLGFGSTGSGRLVYAKPFVAAPKADNIHRLLPRNRRLKGRRFLLPADNQSSLSPTTCDPVKLFSFGPNNTRGRTRC